MVDSSNTLVISTSLANNQVSEKRRNNLINRFSKYNIPILFNYGTSITKIECEITFQKVKNSLELFKKTNFDYCIICDDDLYIMDNFLEELNKTVALLPDNWRVLHLCPGYLWGRIFYLQGKYTHEIKRPMLNPEMNIDTFDYHPSGRFYRNCNPREYCNRLCWLGGPTAFLLNIHSVDNYLDEFIREYNTYNCNNDVVLTKILKNNDFICRNPLLGYEKEEGGTTRPE